MTENAEDPNLIPGGTPRNQVGISCHLIRWLAEADLLYATMDRPPRQTLAALFQNHWSSRPEAIQVVTWAIQGQLTGHEWQACTSCYHVQLTPVGKHRCIMTPDCRGSLQRLAKRPILTQALRKVLR